MPAYRATSGKKCDHANGLELRRSADRKADPSPLLQLEDLLESSGAVQCQTVAASSDNDDVPQQSTSAAAAAAAATSPSEFAIDDVTHIITSSPTYAGFRAVDKRNAHVAKAAEAAGKQAGTAPLQPGQPGELVAVVTVRIFIPCEIAIS